LEALAHRLGSLCSLLLMLQAAILDWLFLYLFPFSENVFVSNVSAFGTDLTI